MTAQRSLPAAASSISRAEHVDELSALSLPMAAELRQLVAEREHLFRLHEALVEAEQAETLDARLRILVSALARLGFSRVVLALRDEGLNQTEVFTSGVEEEELERIRRSPLPGSVWRRRLTQLERFRVSQSFLLIGRDEWVMREFHGIAGGVAASAAPDDVLLVLVRRSDGGILATLKLWGGSDGLDATPALVRAVELFAQQAAFQIEQARLVQLAQRRAERLQRLQEAGTMLSRSLDEGQIVRELARQVGRVVASDGIVIARPDLDERQIVTMLRQVRGAERPRPVRTLGDGVIAEVARTGKPVRLGDYTPAATPLAADDDVVGDGAPARSVLAVPMMRGIQLVGVLALHAAAAHAFSEEDEEVLATMGAQAATAILNARLYSDSERECRQSEALAEVARAVGESLRFGEVLQLILRHTTALLRAEGACVALRKDDYLHVVAGIGGADMMSGLHLPVQGTMAGKALTEGTYVISNEEVNNALIYRPVQRVSPINKIVIVPLITGRGAIGIVAAINRGVDFEDADARVLQRLADHVAVAIVNARLFEEVAEATREWKVAFDAIASGMVVLDEDVRIMRCNARAAELAGSPTPAALIGRHFFQALLHETPDAEATHLFERALHYGETARGTLHATRRGRVFDVIAAPHPNGGAVVTFDDVTSHHMLAERHRSVVETASDAIVITDLDRRIAFANPAAMRLFGRGPELVGIPVNSLVRQDLADEVSHRETSALAGLPQRYECVVLRPDGEERTVSVSTAVLRDVGQVAGIVASLRDVTEERRARTEVARSEERYRDLFESASDAIYTLDLRGNFTSMNAATCRMSGATQEELLGRPSTDFMEPDDLSTVLEHFDAARNGTPRHYECHVRTSDGSRRLLSVTNTPIRQGGKIAGVLGIARDVTEERARAEALELSEARYTRLVEAASDGIVTLDVDGRLTSVNRAFEVALGVPRARLEGSHVTDLVDPRDRESMQSLVTATLAGERQRGEFRYVDARRNARAVSLITAPITEHGQVSGILAVVRDVTEERILAEQVAQREKLAAVGQLVSGVAHELNNPLAGVMAFSELLLTSPHLDHEDQQAAETIHHEARRAARIVGNLLSFARQRSTDHTATDVNKVLRDTLELRQYALRTQQVRIDLELHADLSPTWGDAFQLQQVVLNLLANAEQALAERPGDRRLLVRSEQGEDVVRVVIADNGPGIASEHLGRIFDPFYSTRRAEHARGLGLSISQEIVKEHGGQIQVESAPGQGAAFTIELPISRLAVSKDSSSASTPAGSHEGTATQAVLVVEDEPAIRYALTRYLSTLGYVTESAGGGAEALSLLGRHTYDAVLLDLRMSDVSGADVYERMLADMPAQAARVVFITGDAHSEQAHAFVRGTGRPCLSKPFLLEDLAAALEGMLAGERAARDPEA
jgi:PAS domain S-box-containing protein